MKPSNQTGGGQKKKCKTQFNFHIKEDNKNKKGQ